MTASDVKREREATEQRANEIAVALPDGDYYASESCVVERHSGVYTACGSHWAACLVMMAIHRRMADVA